MKSTLLILIVLVSILNVQAQFKKYPENFGDIFLKGKRKSNPEYSKALMGKNVFSGSLAYSVSKVTYADNEGIVQEYFRNAAIINFNVRPWRDFFIRNSFIIDLNEPVVAPPWLSDYYYQIGYYNWRNKTFSFGYENYQANRWDTFFENFYTNFKRGYFFVSFNYTLSLPENKKKFVPFFWDKTSKLALSPFFRVHPEYTDEYSEFEGYLKPVTGINIRYVIVKNIYVETSLLYYPIEKTKLPWDPDFTYGFGIYNWKAFRMNFSYGNWIANRYPWNQKEIPNYGFMNGEFNINITYSW